MPTRKNDSASTDRKVSPQAKVIPPRHPVDVPNTPARPSATTPDEAAEQRRPYVDERSQSNWADSGAAKPRAKRARTSLL